MFSAADFLTFIDSAPTPFHAVASVSATLKDAGFTEVSETADWPTGGGRFFVVRAGSLIAWIEPEDTEPTAGFRILGAHTDSPNLRVKLQHDRHEFGADVVALEPYGGPILSTWFDRDLGIAGRVVRKDLSEHLVKVDTPTLRVPNLAIHLDRDKGQPNPQQHLNAVWARQGTPFIDFLGQQAGIAAADIAGFELMAFDVTRASLLGADASLISSPRLDNLATVWAALQALLSSSGKHRSVVAFFDHEEVGSQSERGAGSPFLSTTLERIVHAADGSRTEFLQALAQSVVVSGDMAHATHPNYAEKHEPLHRITLGGGPVLKVNTNLRYATDARGAAFFQTACDSAGVPMQRFVNRADLPCGSTIGPISAAETGILTIDVGAPQLAMHSIRETMAVVDLESYYKALIACLEIVGFAA